MDQFKSWDSYNHFSREVSRERRYLLTAESQEFLRVVAITCKPRLTQIPPKRIFFRAQVGNDWQEVDEAISPAAYMPPRMNPLPDRAQEGRANAKGIPCLYLSTTKEAAMSEVRPTLGESVSLAWFEVTRALTVVDCSKLHDQYFNLAFGNRIFDALTSTISSPAPEEIEKIVWAAIDNAFARPVRRSDDVADYAPTQRLAELFRDAGYDGVAYKSAFGEDAFSIALFDLKIAKQVHGALYDVKSVKFEFSESPVDEYYIDDSGKVFRTVITAIYPAPKKG